MHKNLLSLFLLFVISLSSNSQPVLNYDSGHSIGVTTDAYSISGTPANLLLSGANAVWDLSAVPLTPAGSVDLVDPSSTPGFSLYSSSNLAYEQSSGLGTIYNYLIDDANELNIIGRDIGAPNGFGYADPEQLLQYPFSFGASFTDTRQRVSGTLETFNRTYDSYGTLIINGKTYTDVVRIYENTTSAIWYAVTPVISPLIIVRSSGVVYLEPTNPNGIKDIANEASVFVYQGSSKTEVHVVIRGVNDYSSVKMKIFNSLGSEVKDFYITQGRTDFQIKEQAAGVYFFTITNGTSMLKKGKFMFN